MDGITFVELECRAVRDCAPRIVGRYFGSNLDYLYTQARAILDPAPTSSVAKAFHALLTSTEARQHDDRCGTVEIQLSDRISLDTSLWALLLPDFLLGEPEIRD
jgi:hypothetical protein